MFNLGSVVNNGYANFKILKDHGDSVSVKRIDVGKNVCRDIVKLPKDMLNLGFYRTNDLVII